MKKTIRIMETERECVKRAAMPFGCDRECAKCDLVMDADEIIAAYDAVLEILNGICDKE